MQLGDAVPEPLQRKDVTRLTDLIPTRFYFIAAGILFVLSEAIAFLSIGHRHLWTQHNPRWVQQNFVFAMPLFACLPLVAATYAYDQITKHIPANFNDQLLIPALRRSLAFTAMLSYVALISTMTLLLSALDYK
jgi:hypothetical protein